MLPPRTKLLNSTTERLSYEIIFTHKFVRHYDLRTETRSHSLLTLGSTPGSAVEEREEEE